MANPFVAARIPEDLNASLDAFAEASGVSRSAVLADALRAYLGAGNPALGLEARVQQLEEAVVAMRSANARICIDCGADFHDSDGHLCSFCLSEPVDDDRFFEKLSAGPARLMSLPMQLPLIGSELQ